MHLAAQSANEDDRPRVTSTHMNVADQVSLRQRVIRAGLWSLAGFGLNYLIRFGSNLLMTRLLMPEMFGLMSIATTVMIGLTMFSDVGLKQFIVQHSRGNESAYLNTAWIVQILRGVLLWFFSGVPEPDDRGLGTQRSVLSTERLCVAESSSSNCGVVAIGGRQRICFNQVA